MERKRVNITVQLEHTGTGILRPLTREQVLQPNAETRVEEPWKEVSFLFLKSGGAEMGFNVRLSAVRFFFEGSWYFGGRRLFSCPVALITAAGLQSAALWSTK